MNFWRHLDNKRYSKFIPTVLTPAPTWVSKHQTLFPATAEERFLLRVYKPADGIGGLS
jgi:hypothetical protein